MVYSALLQGKLVSPAKVKELQGPPAAPYGYGLYKWDDHCTNDFYYGHGGGTPGYRSIAMSSADGTRQLAFFVAQAAETLATGEPSESTELIEVAQRALDSTCPQGQLVHSYDQPLPRPPPRSAPGVSKMTNPESDTGLEAANRHAMSGS